MRNDGLSRVRFFDRQFLRPQDLVAEQLYHQIAHRRHNIGPHSWGIIAGLTLSLVEGDLYVEPGAAIDGYGRDIVLAERRPIRAHEFDQRGVESLHVWLAYAEEADDGAPDGYSGCVDPTRANGAGSGAGGSPYRWREAPLLLFTDARVAPAPRALPPGVPTADVPFAPQRAFPVEAEQWGVYLGTVERRRAGSPAPFEIVGDGRPYVDLVAWRISHPGGAGRIELGSESDSARRFAVYIGEDLPTANPRIAIDRPAGSPKATLTIRGETVVQGTVTVETGTVGFRGTPRYEDDPSPREGQIYRCTATDLDDPNQTNDELRIEMGASPAPVVNRVAIGKFNSETKRFEPCLTITDTCLVRVYGNLVVDGAMPNKPVVGSGQQSAAFAARYQTTKQLLAASVAANLATTVATTTSQPAEATVQLRGRAAREARLTSVAASLDDLEDQGILDLLAPRLSDAVARHLERILPKSSEPQG